MPNGLINLALGLAIQVGTPGPSEQPNLPSPARAYGQYGFGGSAEQYHPSDSQMNWVHGYHQEIPAYGGYPVFRPNNYKDVLSQSQTAAGWGERPAMPYSQQFWHKYQDQAAMLKMSRNQASPSPFISVQHTQQQQQQQQQQQTPGWVVQPNGVLIPQQQYFVPQSTLPPVQNAIVMPDSLQPPPIQSPNDFSQISFPR